MVVLIHTTVMIFGESPIESTSTLRRFDCSASKYCRRMTASIYRLWSRVMYSENFCFVSHKLILILMLMLVIGIEILMDMDISTTVSSFEALVLSETMGVNSKVGISRLDPMGLPIRRSSDGSFRAFWFSGTAGCDALRYLCLMRSMVEVSIELVRSEELLRSSCWRRWCRVFLAWATLEDARSATTTRERNLFMALMDDLEFVSSVGWLAAKPVVEQSNSEL